MMKFDIFTPNEINVAGYLNNIVGQGYYVYNPVGISNTIDISHGGRGTLVLVIIDETEN